MANEVKIKLTDEQKAKIKEGTGHDIPEVHVATLGANPAVATKAAPRMQAKKAARLQTKIVAKKAARLQTKIVAKKAARLQTKIVAKKAARLQTKIVAKKAAKASY